MNNFEVKEMDALISSLDKIILEKNPKIAESFMRKKGSDLARYAKKYARKNVKKRTGNYLRGFKRGKKVYKWTDADYNLQVYNSAPHAHLIELGHYQKTSENEAQTIKRGSGKGTDYVPGKYVMQNAAKAFEADFFKSVEDDLLEQMKKRFEK